MSKSFAFKKNCANKIPKSDNFSKADKNLTDRLKNDLNKLNELIDNQDLNNYIKQVIEFLLIKTNILMTRNHGP